MSANQNPIPSFLRRGQVRGGAGPQPDHPVHGRARSGHHSAAPGNPPAPDLIAPGGFFEVPSLAGVAPEYIYNGSTSTICRLARSLLRAEIATPETWQSAGKQPVRFIRQVLAQFAENTVGGHQLLHNFFDVDTGILDQWNEYASSRRSDPDPERVYIVMAGECVIPLLVGKFYEKLFAIHPRLPATFYEKFVPHGFGHFFRVLDHANLQQEIENIDEMCDPDDEDEQETIARAKSYKAEIPRYLKRKPLPDTIFRRIVKRLPPHSQVRQALELADEMEWLTVSTPRVELDDQDNDLLYDCGVERPVISLHFHNWDGLRGLLDDEMNQAMECMPYPSAFIPLQVSDPASVRRAFDQLAVRLKMLVLGDRMLRFLPEHEDK